MNSINELENRVDKIDHKLAGLKDYVEKAAGRTALHQSEETIHRGLLEIGRLLIEEFIEKAGPDHDYDSRPQPEDGRALEYKGKSERSYFSIFGEIKFKRARYLKPSGQYYSPLDARLQLPEKKYSYLLQKWLQGSAVEDDYREAANRFNELFGYSLSANMIRRITGDVSEHVDDFYDQLQAPLPETEGDCLAIGADCKGVRVVKSERSEPSSPETTNARLGKGEKPGQKKMAVVAIDYSFNPQARSPEEIVKSLLNQFTPEEHQQAKEEKQQRRQHQKTEPRAALNKHQRAFFESKATVMNYLAERIEKRDPHRQKPIVALVDGERSLEKTLAEALSQHGLSQRVEAVVLDIIHVSEYIWRAANAVCGEKNPQRIHWVEEKLLAILNGQVGYVIGALKQILKKSKLNQAKKNALKIVITYFENHKHMMDYKRYLQNGYPISTGLVEAACGSLVKDRMEESGMRWTIKGAKAILELRAVKKNKDWDAFWKHHVETQNKKIYADSYYSGSRFKKKAA